MPREHWTDDRMDDLVKHVDRGFAQGREDTRELRQQGIEFRREMKEDGEAFRREMKAQGGEINQQFLALTHRFDALQRTLLGGFLAGVVAFFASHFA